MKNYQLPTLPTCSLPLSLLSKEEENEKTGIITSVFNDFGIQIRQVSVTPGPVVSFWELCPEDRIRLSKLQRLESELLKALDIQGTRLICPVPGKGTIGLEIPNNQFQTIPLSAVINTKEFVNAQMELPLALGVTVAGKPYIVDLVKMPHILIAGATGMGKSVTQHAIILSILCSKRSDDVKFVLIDFHKVEFSGYKSITPFLAKSPLVDDNIVTGVGEAINTLESLCELMDQRYSLLKKTRARNIIEYNKRIKDGKLDPALYQHMPYIVTIIDEYGGLIMTAGYRVELLIARLAQLSRAVGIHLIISTQRPSASIITGTIKANFPCCIAHRVSSLMDSRMILNYFGAERLRGQGDMLFSCGREPIRLQGAYADCFEDCPSVCEQIVKQLPDSTPYLLPLPQKDEQTKQSDNTFHLDNLDPLFEDAAKFFVETQMASTSQLQRQFSIGYNRAGRIMDMLEQFGIIGSRREGTTHEVLISDSAMLKEHLEKLKSRMAEQQTTVQEPKRLFVNGEYNCDKELFSAVAKCVVEHQNASISFIQRSFNLGFNEAELIIDKLAMHGIVGPAVRPVLVKDVEDLDRILNDK